MSGLIPKSFIQDIINRVDIVEIIGSRISLKKQGKTYACRCPFHDEKTPSFSVISDKQFYYCFGCGAHGNAISFLMAYDRMEFPEVIEYLAAQLGLDVPRENGVEQKKPDIPPQLYTVMENVNRYYQQQLRNSREAIDYLKSRGLDGKIAKKFQLGCVSDQWDNLVKLVGNKAQQLQLLQTAGMLIQKNPDHYYDRFRHRLMFPIRNRRGQLIGFGGRCFGDEKPKYLNSPETPVFQKNQELYGLYETLQEHRALEKVLVVEGYMDVIALFQHGVNYAVATLGTAVNRQHIQTLLRHSKQIIFCFDGDRAGSNAAWKALVIALPLLRDGVHFHFLFLPQGHDPDSLVRAVGQNQFEKLINDAEPLEEVFFKQLKHDYPPKSLEGKAHFVKMANQHIEAMPQGIYRQLMQKRIAEIVDVPESDLHRMLSPQNIKQTAAPTKKIQTAMMSSAELAIAILLQKPSLIASIKDYPLFDILQQADAQLLHKLILLLKQTPLENMGGILAYWQDDNECQLLSSLCARPLYVEKSEMAGVLIHAIEHLQSQVQQKQLTVLVEQAKIRELSDAEKKSLRSLLAIKTSANKMYQALD